MFISSPDFSTEVQRQISSCLMGTSTWICCRHFKRRAFKVNPASSMPANGPAFPSQGFQHLLIRLSGHGTSCPSLLPSCHSQPVTNGQVSL